MDVPRSLQLNIVGVNQLNQTIINVVIITFTNNCGAYPVLSNGQVDGWVIFVSFGRENVRSICFFGSQPMLRPFPPPLNIFLGGEVGVDGGGGGVDGGGVGDGIKGQSSWLGGLSLLCERDGA